MSAVQPSSNQGDLLLWVAGGVIAAIGAAWLVITQPWKGAAELAETPPLALAPAPSAAAPPALTAEAEAVAGDATAELGSALDNPLRILDSKDPRDREAFLALKGIGPWSADYVAMRCGDRDILLETDLGVRLGGAGTVIGQRIQPRVWARPDSTPDTATVSGHRRVLPPVSRCNPMLIGTRATDSRVCSRNPATTAACAAAKAGRTTAAGSSRTAGHP